MRNNPTGKGGFQDHPELINKAGRPPKEQSVTAYFDEFIHGVDEEGIDRRAILSQKLWGLVMAGDIAAIRYAFDRLDGTPKQRIDHIESSLDRDWYELAQSFYGEGEEPGGSEELQKMYADGYQNGLKDSGKAPVILPPAEQREDSTTTDDSSVVPGIDADGLNDEDF